MKHAIALLIYALTSASVIRAGARGEIPGAATIPIMLCMGILFGLELAEWRRDRRGR